MHRNEQGDNRNGDLLDLSFVTEWSDDEGIGSDVSLENSDQSSSSGTLNTSDTLRRENKLVKIPKRNISVKKFVRILRRSVGTSETVTTETTDNSVSVTEQCQFQSQKVFGVDLTEHLDQESCRYLVERRQISIINQYQNFTFSCICGFNDFYCLQPWLT